MTIYGTLTLIPTPLDDEAFLEPAAHALLSKAAIEDNQSSIFVIEDLKPGRRRWLHFNLPRSAVDSFVLYNEHNAKTISLELVKELELGRNIYLMSDGGLPAFCDPGVELVDLCHRRGIKVTSTPFANSMALAVALSGFVHKKFYFQGFLPLEASERNETYKQMLNSKIMSVFMDTPYRLKRVLEELKSIWSSKKQLFVALDLNCHSEQLLRGSPSEILGAMSDFKREFVMIISE